MNVDTSHLIALEAGEDFDARLNKGYEPVPESRRKNFRRVPGVKS